MTTKLQNAPESALSEPSGSQIFPHSVQTAFVFAARYTHHRPTAGAFAVTSALAYVWRNLSEGTQDQIIRESHEATCNLTDWATFRGDTANNEVTNARHERAQNQ